MALSEAKRAADKRHVSKLDNIMVRPYKEEGAAIRAAAAAAGKSVQGYILEAVREKMGSAGAGSPAGAGAGVAGAGVPVAGDRTGAGSPAGSPEETDTQGAGVLVFPGGAQADNIFSRFTSPTVPDSEQTGTERMRQRVKELRDASKRRDLLAWEVEELCELEEALDTDRLPW